MTISPLPLSYCTNVHPARTIADVHGSLTEFTLPIRERWGQRLAAGLWLSRSVINDLQTEERLDELIALLRENDLPCYTLNAFPFGDFHSDRVKDRVYLPDWSTSERQQYTLDCGRVLTRLLGDETEGSISTMPLAFKRHVTDPKFIEHCCNRLIDTARQLAQLRTETGKTVRLAIEPEPLCLLETTPETLQFFRQLRDAAQREGAADQVTEHIGVCYDVCHQSVEFEDAAASIQALDRAGIRINKVQLSSAIETSQAATRDEVLSALTRYVEPRYLHQTVARGGDGSVTRYEDLTTELLASPTRELMAADVWRIHFHVPLNAESLGPLGTTRHALLPALQAVRDLAYTPHLEVETYTWEVLPDGGRPNVVAGLAAELAAAQALCAAV